MRGATRDVRFGPRADIRGAKSHVRSYPENGQLFLAVFLHVGFSSFFGVVSSVKRVAPGGVCMMPSFFVPPVFMMFGCFTVMMRGMRMMFRSLLMVLRCFF
jgi:hypothetical protein